MGEIIWTDVLGVVGVIAFAVSCLWFALRLRQPPSRK